MSTSNQLVVGKTSSVQSTWQPWPEPWKPWPHSYVYPTTRIYREPEEEYANEIEVDQNEHDAVLRFYRRRKKGSRVLVKEVTVPIGVLKWLQGGEIG